MERYRRDGYGDNPTVQGDQFQNDAANGTIPTVTDTETTQMASPSDGTQWNDSDATAMVTIQTEPIADDYPNDPDRWSDTDGDRIQTNKAMTHSRTMHTMERYRR